MVRKPPITQLTDETFEDALHIVELGLKTSDGHKFVNPLQLSAASQTPVEFLHIPLVLFESEGHAAEDPVHVSAAPHNPEDALQIVPVAFNISVHVAEVPEQ